MKKLLTASAIILLLFACKEGGKEKKLTIKGLDSLYQKTVEYRDSVNRYWKLINESDSQKLADIKTLLYQISLTKAPNLSLVEEGNKKWDNAASLKYGQADVGNNTKVDLFDNTCDSLIRFVSDLKAATPNEQNYPLLEDIMTDIRTNNNLDLAARLRSHYNKWAEMYNEALEELTKANYPAASYMKKIDSYGYAD